MGHKKRNPTQRPRHHSSAATTTASPDGGGGPAIVVLLGDDDDKNHHYHPNPNNPNPDLSSHADDSPRKPPPPPPPSSPPAAADATVKAECERALTALRRGNHTKALRLMKEACLRHDSSALIHRVHGTISVKVASLMDDPNAKLRHLHNAVDSARRAAALSPDSVEFAHFYANLLYEAATDNKGYEEVVQECERALSIPEPVDPARESLHDESQQRLPTSEARIAHVHQELRSLIQKSNIASISTWMKNLGGGAGAGEEKFRLIPMRRLSEDPMEVRLVQATRRPNEIKKATKTPEERRKEIEVRVAAARLLQQKSQPQANPSQEDEASSASASFSPSPSSSSSSGAQRLVERRKMMNVRKLMSSAERMDQVRTYWNSMSPKKRQGFLEISITELRSHYSKDSLALDAMLEAISFAEANGTWKFWDCCRCSEKFVDSESHMQHLTREHMGCLTPKLQSALPQEVDGEWVEMLLSGSWKPIDAYAVIKMIEEEQSAKCQSAVADFDSDVASKDKDSSSDYWSSKDTSDSSSSPQQGELNIDELCNVFPVERRENGHTHFDPSGSNDILQRWPLSDDTERAKLLERIHGMFQLLLKQKCLSVSHLNKVVQFSMDELQGLPSGSNLLSLSLDQSPLCICFLGAPELRKVFKFLQELSLSCGLGRYSDKNSLADDAPNVIQGCEVLQKIVLCCDSSTLLLDSRLFKSRLISSNIDSSVSEDGEEAVDANALVSWLFAGPSSGEQLTAWTRLGEERSHQGMEILQMLEKEFCLLQNMCERKCEHICYEEALQTVENLCVEEFKRREHAVKSVSQSYEAILRKRRDELIEVENDAMFMSSRFELDAISNVLKEVQSLSVSQFGYDETLSGVTSRLCDLDCVSDDDWRAQGYLHQADTCVEVAMQRQKEQLSVELSKIDARIMRNLNGMQQLEHKLGPTLAFDYREVILPLVKSFMRAYLEDLVDKDAMKKSEAAREAFLAELALDAKKSANKGNDQSKQSQEKSKDKKRSKDYRKPKEIKDFGGGGQALLNHEMGEKLEFLVAADVSPIEPELVKGGESGDYLNQQEEENRRKIELEAEERKLEETLEYQRRIENEAKQRHLAEQSRKANASFLGNPTSSDNIDSNLNAKYLDEQDEFRHSKQANISDNCSSVCMKGIDFGDFHWPEVTLPKHHQGSESNQFKIKLGENDLFLSSEAQKVTFSYREKSDEAYANGTPTFGQNIGLANDFEGLEKNVHPEKSSTSFSDKKVKKTSNHSQLKYKRGPLGALQDGVLHSDQRTIRQANQHNNSARSSEGNFRPVSERENPFLPRSQSENHLREQAHAASPVYLHGGTLPTHLNAAKAMKQAEYASKSLEASSGENGTKTLGQLHAEEDDEERFQADLKKAVLQSLDTFQAQKNVSMAPVPKSLQIVSPEVGNGGCSVTESTEKFMGGKDILGAGLKNEVGEYNCFLNVIIQSLWHLRRFRDEFLKSSLMHMHVGDPCVVCALYDIFTSLSKASVDTNREAVAPTCLRSALSNLYPDSNFFQEAQMNDASEVLAVIFDSLHRSFTSIDEHDSESVESNCMGSWDCKSDTCIVHTLFGMDIYERMNCHKCGVESRHLKYTSFFHNINANALRTMKITCADSSLDELLKLVEMNHQLACDIDSGGCGKPNYIHHILSTPPHVFTTVLGWQNTCENIDDISATLAAIDTELDIGVLYRGLDQGNKYSLVSMVCYYGQHYHCFAYSHEHDKWIMYDDKTVKVIGGWSDVTSMCEKGHLQPQVLFFEAAN